MKVKVVAAARCRVKSIEAIVNSISELPEAREHCSTLTVELSVKLVNNDIDTTTVGAEPLAQLLFSSCMKKYVPLDFYTDGARYRMGITEGVITSTNASRVSVQQRKSMGFLYNLLGIATRESQVAWKPVTGL